MKVFFRKWDPETLTSDMDCFECDQVVMDKWCNGITLVDFINDKQLKIGYVDLVRITQ